MFNWALFFGPDIFRKLYEADIVPCEGFFVVERSLLNTSLPKNALSPAEIKAYILYCRSVGGWKRVSWINSNALLRQGGIKVPAKRAAAIEALKAKHFLTELEGQEGKRKFQVLGVPLYSRRTKSYIPSPVRRNVKSMRAAGSGYIQVPNEIVDRSIVKHLSGRQLRVLLKLYEFNRLEVYGGLDPNAIALPDPGEGASVSLERIVPSFKVLNPDTIRIDDILYMDLNLTRDEFMVSLRGLAQRGLVKLERRPVSEEEDRIIVRCHGDSGNYVYVLRPVYQLRRHVERWEGSEDGE